MTGEKTVAENVVEALREIGVKYVFGVPSGGWVDYMEALRKADGIEFVLTSHEGAAGMMADVCGRLSGVPGACFGTFGPGATNLATGVGEALLDRSPMIAFSDEMPASMRGRTTQMGIDHQALFAPLTKKTTRLSADAVKSILFDAARTAANLHRLDRFKLVRIDDRDRIAFFIADIGAIGESRRRRAETKQRKHEDVFFHFNLHFVSG